MCSHLATSELRRVMPRARARKIITSTHRELSSSQHGDSNIGIPLYGGGAPPTAASPPVPPVTLGTLNAMYRRGAPISVVTAYDYTSATLCDQAGADCLLVGDSLGMVVQGLDSTVAVTLDDMLRACQAVTRAARRPFVVGDLPFGTYMTPDDALRAACRLVKEGGVDAVKLEGGMRSSPAIDALVRAGFAVQAHIGLTPQSASALGGYKVLAL